jgi:hypothetical protein
MRPSAAWSESSGASGQSKPSINTKSLASVTSDRLVSNKPRGSPIRRNPLPIPITHEQRLEEAKNRPPHIHTYPSHPSLYFAHDLVGLEQWVVHTLAQRSEPVAIHGGVRVPMVQTELWREVIKVDACGQEVVRLVSVHNESLSRAMMKNWNIRTKLKQQVLVRVDTSVKMHEKVAAQVYAMKTGR